MSSDCVFCKIGRGQIPSQRILEDELTVAVLDVDRGTVQGARIRPEPLP